AAPRDPRPRAFTDIEQVSSGEVVERRLVARSALRLPVGTVRSTDVGTFVPVETQPAEVAELARLCARDDSGRIEVLDAQDQAVARSASRQPRDQRGGGR